jgi:hypothetical protein
MEGILVGLGAIALGLIQMFIGYRSFKKFKATANASTSAFSMYGLWSGFFVGILFMLVGIAAMTGHLGM